MKELLNIFPKEIVNYIIFDYLLPTDSFNGVIESLDKHRFLWSISYINSFARYFFSDMKVDKYLRDYQKQKQTVCEEPPAFVLLFHLIYPTAIPGRLRALV